MAELLNFDEWNRAVTARICANEDPVTGAAVRRERSGASAYIYFWDDYLADCAAENRACEPKSF